MKQLYLYADETGNTGENLFDKSQPYFWNGVLISEFDFDKKYGKQVDKLCENLRVEELHANELGITRINSISRFLQNFVNQKGVKLHFVQIEKEFALKLKLFDYFFDPGINKGISLHHYAFRALRISLSLYFTHFIEEAQLKLFWQIYKKPTLKMYLELFSEIRDKIMNQESYTKIKYDKRATEVLLDALEYAILEPGEFIGQIQQDYDLPNAISMSLLTISITNLYKDEEVEIVSVIHDTQKDYGKALKEVHKYIKVWQPSFDLTDHLLDIKKTNIYKSNLDLVNSKESKGIQVIDIILWLMKKSLQDKKELHGDIDALVKTAIKKSTISNITYNGYLQEAEKIRQWSSIPLSQEQNRVAKENLAFFNEQSKLSISKSKSSSDAV